MASESRGDITVTMKNGETEALQCAYFSKVPHHAMQGWEAQIAGLSPKKQRQWKDAICDERRQRSSVRFDGTIFQSRMSAVEVSSFRNHVLPKDGWAAVISDVHFQELVIGTSSAYILHALGLEWGQVASVRLETVAASAVEMAITPDGTIDEVAVRHMQLDNHTGRHYRNHTIHVPTEPGQPTRG